MAVSNDVVMSKARYYGNNNDSRGWNNWANSNQLTVQQSIDGGREFERTVNARNQNGRSTTSSGNYNLGEGGNPASYASDILFKSTLSKSTISQIPETEKVSAEKFREGLINQAKMKELVAREIGLQLERESQLRTDINEKIGVTGKLSEALTNTIIESESESLKFGYSMNDISKMYVSMADTSGKFNFMSQETLNKSFATSRAFVGTLDDLGKLMGEFEKIGLGSDDTIKSIDRTGRSSLSLGLNSKKTTELLKGDLSKLNEYGFKNGIDGLNRMVQKSLEFRMSMKEVFTIADKVMNPDGAIELAANLQVLGGAMGAFNDPMQMMYMATNNVEGLQDALIGAASTLATYNTEQGKFEITGVNLRRAKEMAAQMGISYQELAKGAIAANERLSVTQDLAAKGFNLSKGDEEFIANLSQMKGGEMVITLPQNVAGKIGMAVETPISKLSSGQIEELKKNRDLLIQMNPEEIAKNQFSTIVNMDRNVESLANKFVRGGATAAREEGIGDLDKRMNEAFSNFNTLFQRGENTETVLQSYMNSVVGLFRQGLQETGANQGVIKNAVDLLLPKLQNQATELRAAEIQREKDRKALETKPTENPLSYGGRVNTRIDVVFPQGYGTPPQAEVQHSYLTPYLS
jgi:hypothetical protein